MSRKLDEIDLDNLNDKSKKIRTDSNEAEDLQDEVLNEEEEDLIISNESLYGIKDRINKEFKRFNGLIKQSPADFIVNEIDLEKNVVRLTNFDLPVLPANPALQEENSDEFDKMVFFFLMKKLN